MTEMPVETAGPSWQDRAVSRSLRRARSEAEARSARIVRAAMDLVLESPGGDFTLQGVVARVRMSTRTFYQHFPSKDDLLVAMFEEAQRDGVRSLREAIAGESDPVARLRLAVVMRQTTVSRTSLSRLLVHHHFRLQESHPEELRHALSPVVTLFRELIAEAAAAGEINVADIDLSTTMLLQMVTAAAQAWVLESAPTTHSPTAEDVWQFCLSGLKGEGMS